MVSGVYQTERPTNWPSGERDYVILETLDVPRYEMGIDKMIIHDVVWGDCVIKKRTEAEETEHRANLAQQGIELGEGKSDDYDALLLELAQNPLFIRLQAVEQLTFSERFSTTPNTSRFSRWQHVWGSLVFARKMTENDARFSERDRIIFQLRTLFSDVGQTAFSHLGDWIFQGIQGGEDLHDQDLKALLRVFDMEELLAKYDLTIDETVFPEVSDWVECPSPDLCVDRLDYGLREILRWASPPLPLMLYKNALANPKLLFEIDDKQRLIIKNQKFARYFVAGFSLLPADDWSHPTHRVQMEMMQVAVKGALLEKADESSTHVRELLYLVDRDFDIYFAKWSGMALGNLMKSIAFEQRRIFTVARLHDLSRVFTGIQNDKWRFPEFPHPLKSYSWVTEEFGEYPIPAQISVKEVEIATQRMKATQRGLEIGLPSLKARRIDPLVKAPSGVARRFSQLEPSYRAYVQGLQEFMSTNFVATIHMRQDFAQKIVTQRNEIGIRWREALGYMRSDEQLRRAVGHAAIHLFNPNSGNHFDAFEFSKRYQRLMEELAAKAIYHKP